MFSWIEAHLPIHNKEGKLVPFILNEVQCVFAEFVAECWENGFPVEALIPKARQHGISTLIQAILFTLCVLDPGYRCVVVSHVEDSSTRVFRMTRVFYKHVPEGLGGDLDTKQKNLFEWESLSRFEVSTAKAGDALCKSGTYNGFHGTEVANWADMGMDPHKAWSSAAGAIAKGESRFVVFESTAKGQDIFFHDLTSKAIAGENDWMVLFFPWYLASEYSMTWKDYRRKRLRKGIDPGKVFEPTEEEEELRRRVGAIRPTAATRWTDHPAEITDAQLIYRRHLLVNDYHGNMADLKRYMPTFISDCWSTSTTSMFPPEIQRFYRLDSCDPEEVGVLRRALRGPPEWVPDVAGPIKIWKQPLPGRDYVIGADTAMGRRKSDFSAAYVIDKKTLEAVACYHNRLDPDSFADELYRLGVHYNDAYLAVENNWPATVHRLMKREYPNLFYRRNELIDTSRPAQAGWNTNRQTRPLMLAAVGEATRRKILRCRDEGFATEMEHFTWDTKKQRFAAQGAAKDDRIMAMAIALCLCDLGGRRRRELGDVAEQEDAAVREYKERVAAFRAKIDKKDRAQAQDYYVL